MRTTDVMVEKTSDSVQWIAAKCCEPRVAPDDNVKSVAEGRRLWTSHIQFNVPFVFVDERLSETSTLYVARLQVAIFTSHQVINTFKIQSAICLSIRMCP